MENTVKIAYAEVYEILKHMNKKIVMKIPIEVLQLFKDNKEKNYIPNIDKEDIFNKNNITTDTLRILAWLNINYWVEEVKKKELIDLYRKNDFEHEIDLKNKYNLTHKELFKSSDNIIVELPTVIEEKNIFKRIINLIKKKFRR